MTTERRRSRLLGRGGGSLAAAASCLAVSAVLLPAPAAVPTSVRASSSGADTVTIVTDSAGIPHITASNFRALGYGEAWAFSEDNFCTLANDFVTVEGERSKYFGPNGLAVNYSAGVDPANLDSDLFWKYVAATGLYQQQSKLPPPLGPLPQVKHLYQGFVQGYNAYLASGKLDDPTCKGKAWVKPITMEDMFLRGLQIATEASSQQFITYLDLASPPSAAAGAARPATARLDVAALRALRESGASTRGSNGIAVGAEDTRYRNGMVLANPHFPWIGTERFWMAQLTVPGKYDVEGGTLEGFPLIGIGFNANLAWTHTVSTSERFTFYRLTLEAGHPTSYVVDGKDVPMGKVTVSVDTGEGTVHHTFYTTRWGPVVDVTPATYGWSTTNAYTVDDVNWANEYRAANQYFEMGRATSVEDLLAVEEKYLAIPTFNTIAADDHGDVLYGDVGNTPNVAATRIARCTPPGLPEEVYQLSGLVTLDGSRSSCRWGRDRGTPIPGIFDGAQEPHTIRRDYVENSNDSYWLANPSHPFPAFSPIIGKIDVPQGLRTRLGNLMIEKRVAGTDGLGSPKFTIRTMEQMWESDQSLLAQLVLKRLVADCTAHPSATASDGKPVSLGRACDALRLYEATENGHLDAKGGWLFSVWYADAPSTQFWERPFEVAHPLTTPSGLDTANPAILTALADAVQSLRARKIPLDASYGEVQHVIRHGKVIPIPGCDTGCFNAIYTSGGNGNPFEPGDYGTVVDGSSLVMTTELTPHGPVSRGILTYSQATNPRSPWYSNMTTLYSEGKWVRLPYTEKELEAQPGNRTVVLHV
ncbi:MAG TPA: penicillin acylase family protein [Acidimicrobiales bacterium]|nr:penicillin acylase family protein [Acidimicrobiales bacterium]